MEAGWIIPFTLSMDVYRSQSIHSKSGGQDLIAHAKGREAQVLNIPVSAGDELNVYF